MMTGGLKKDQDTVSSPQPSPPPAKEPKSVWVFGYGSLIWKTNFPYSQKVVGYVRGYVRRFWQASIEHRGTPEAPGRVATLIEDKEECTWGLAYQVDPHDVPEVMAYLDRRETGGYTTHELTFYPHDISSQTLTVLVYIATETNPNHLGPAPLETIAHQIITSRGKSGNNIEYVMELATSMRLIAPHVVDHHLYELEAKIKELLQKRNGFKSVNS